MLARYADSYPLLACYVIVVVTMMAIWIGGFLLMAAHLLVRIKNHVVATFVSFALPVLALIIVWHLSWKVAMPLYDFALEAYDPNATEQDRLGAAALFFVIGYAHYRIIAIGVSPIGFIAVAVTISFAARTVLQVMRGFALHVSNKASDPTKSPFGYLAALLNIIILSIKFTLEIAKT